MSRHTVSPLTQMRTKLFYHKLIFKNLLRDTLNTILDKILNTMKFEFLVRDGGLIVRSSKLCPLWAQIVGNTNFSWVVVLNQ